MALYHTAKGSVDYTIVGSPTIVDGVASGFSRGNYCAVSSAFIDSGEDLELCVTFTTNTTTNLPIFGVTNAYNNQRPFLSLHSGGDKVRFKIANGLDLITDYRISTGVKYKAIVSRSGTTYTLNLYSGETLLDTQTLTSETLIGNGASNQFAVGYDNSTYAKGFNGSIDLNSTYIKVNGQPWFGVCPIEVKKHQLMGPVGYTKVGSPTIVDGVVSGFSNNNYLSTSTTLPVQASSLEILTRIKLDIDFANTRYFMAAEVRSAFILGLTRTNTNNYTLGVWIGNSTGDGPGWNINTSITATDGSWLYVKFVYDGQSYICYYGSQTNNLSTAFTRAATYPPYGGKMIRIGQWYNADNNFFQGSIDLNETYIKVNGKLWFYQPAPTKYIIKDDKLVFADQGLYLSGPVNYTVVGSPTIEDNVASGFDENNYLPLTTVFNPLSKPYEIVISFTSSNNGSDYIFTSQIGNVLTQRFGICVIRTNSHYVFRTGTSTTAFTTLTGVASTPNNTYCRVKVGWDGQKRYIYIYNFNTNEWELDAEENNTTPTVNLTSSYFGLFNGHESSVIYPFNGSIDLNNTYIKIDGQLWFYGKNYASKNIAPVPANYTYGTTTTPSIGYVDMRTQVFTAAPSGATIGRDE